MKWSILVLTVPRRIRSFFPTLMEELERQTASHVDIEILALYDNKRMSVGEKRNILLDSARGDYVCFMDDDDWIAPDYISEIYKALDRSVDVVTHLVEVTTNGQNKRICTYDLEEKDRAIVGNDGWKGPPSHTMAWRRELAQLVRFPSISMYEDAQWADAVRTFAKTQTKIDKVLYYYKFNNMTTETR